MKFKDIETAEQLLQSLNAPISNPGWTMAYHYTNLESLFQIYKNKTLKLSNMTGMNDLLEKNFAKTCNDYFFCLSRGKKDNIENFGMWAMYGCIREKKINDEDVTDYAKKIGVKIAFSKRILENITNQNSDLTMRLIAYGDFISGKKCLKIKSGSSSSTKKELHLDNSLYGYLKDNSWSYEKELRLCLSYDRSENYTPKDNSVFVSINEELLKNLEVYPSPLYDTEKCYELFEKLKKHNKSESIITPNFKENKYKSLYQDGNHK